MSNSASPKRSTTLELLTYGGEVVHMKAERVSLTDMWKAAGSPANRDLAQWLRSADAERFISTLGELLNMGDSHIDLVQTSRGAKTGGTWAHWQIAMNYARYLDPAFAAKCNLAVRERIEGRTSGSAVSFADDKRAKSVIGNMIKNCTGVAIRDAMPEIAEEVVRRLPEQSSRTVVALADYRPASKPPAGVAELIATHRTLVHIDEAMFDDDGKPRGDGHIASGQAVAFAFRALMAAPCADRADVTAKVDYLLHGTIGDRDSLVDVLLGGLQANEPSLTDPASPLMLFLQSLVATEGNGGQH